MMHIKDQLDHQDGFRFLMESLEFCSAIGRKKLMHRLFITNSFELSMELDIQQAVCDFVESHRNGPVLAKLTELLCQTNDISNSVVALIDGNVLDDIQLFEIKKFSLISWKISQLLSENHFDWIPFHDLNLVIDTLDPEKNRLPITSFQFFSCIQSRHTFS